MAELIARPDSARQRIIVALDVADEEQLVGLVNKLLGQVGFVKIGKELFTALGPKAVELVINSGLKVFLDLKYHDIPNTVAGAVQAAARLGVDMLTVHASGGSSMLRAATAAAQESQKKPAIIAVTVLTSLGDPDLVDL
ncbi:MAG: orotidine-5'-phosphate decarboxylase, partial [Deltaproteobacteria bacterium]|nr:orotidine-5'-phosphate decarboxylase [Deltaproteobacteria bacterium]